MPGSKATRIADSLRERIAGAEWQESGVLPNERDLSRAYGVARNTIRRALMQLVLEGMLERHVGRGTTILCREPQDDNDLHRTVGQLLRISPLDLMNMRMILEPQTAAAAAMAAGQVELEHLAKVHRGFDAISDRADLERMDWAFHSALAGATRNTLLGYLQDILNTLAAGFSSEALGRKPATEEMARIMQQHGAIVEAIAARDAEAAAEAMKQHLSVAAGTLLAGGMTLIADTLQASAAPAPRAPDRPGQLLAIMRQISGTSPLDIMAVRQMIEPQVAAVAAANAREEDFERLREAHETALASTDIDGFEHWDGIFHKRLFESTRNDFLTALHEVLYLIRTRDRWMQVKRRAFSEERRQRYCAEHEEIYRAITSRNTLAAAATMRRHMLSVSMFLFGR